MADVTLTRGEAAMLVSALRVGANQTAHMPTRETLDAARQAVELAIKAADRKAK